MKLKIILILTSICVSVACNNKSNGNLSSYSKLDNNIKLSKIDGNINLKATLYDEGNIELTWNQIVQANKYDIFKNGDFITTVTNTNFMFTADQIDQANNIFQVQGHANGDYTDRSNISEVNTEAKNEEVVFNFSGKALSQSENEIKWETNDSDKLKGFEIYRNGNYYKYLNKNDGNLYKDAGLTSNTIYKYKVRAHYYSDELLPFTEELSIKTLETGNDDSPPVNHLVDTETPKEIIVNGSVYNAAFSDEFNNSSGIDTNKWNARKLWGPDLTINNEKQYYVDPNDPAHAQINYNPFKFSGSDLAIRAEVTPDDKKHLTKNLPYMSGVLTTKGKYKTKYGYFEIKAKIPAHNGTFPAFWLLHDRFKNQNTKRFEIDIFENLGHRPDLIYTTVHHYLNVGEYYDGFHVQESQPIVNYSGMPFSHLGKDFSENFHRYAVEWEPGKVTWYIDGIKVNELTSDELKEGDSALDHEETYIIVNLAMGGNWLNNADWGGVGYDFPNENDLQNSRANAPEMKIDYIRAYKKK